MSGKKYFVFVMIIIIPVQTTRIITTLKYSSRYRVMPTVVNGVTAAIGQTPYVVSIKESETQNGTSEKSWLNLCGGGIIGNTLVLTAGHCFERNDFIYAKNPQTLRVIAGVLKNKVQLVDVLLHNQGVQWRRIAKVKVHEYFHFPMNDLALVFLNEPWIYSPYVKPAHLPKRKTELFRDCWTAGYGRVGFADEDKASDELLIAAVTTMPSWQCSSFWELNMDTYICSDSTTTDVAEGDSGSPMVCIAAAEGDNKQLIEGIVCGKNFDKTTLYTRVSAYSDWIRKNMACKVRIHNIILSITLFLTN